jgi:sialate O-acetylesterase
MIAPLGPFAFRGVIWYQGESNVGRADTYARHFAAMIADWRRQFRTPELPFYFVQIAPFAYSNDTGNAAELRFQQLLTHRQVPNTGIAITMDIGDPGDIHPRNKQDVGMRLALWALRFAYGKDDVNASGPLFRDVDVESGRLRVHFDHAEGLATTDGKAPSLFEIRGAEGAWVPARAEIQGETILLSSPDVAAPRMARFARGAADRPNLTNAAGLPASTFRTGGSMDSGG